MSKCIFCEIAAKDTPAAIEVETENVIVFASMEPAAETHFLIVPKKHIESFASLTSTDKDLLSEMVNVAQNLIKEHNLDDGYRMIFNGGKIPSIKHIHWHLLAGKLAKDVYERI